MTDPSTQRPSRPRDYALLNAVWISAMVGVLKATAAGRLEAPPATELPVLGLAAFSASKAVAKEKVGVWVRAPVVEPTEDGRKPKGDGLRYTLGELVTCTRCIGTWSSLGLVGLRVARPREGRIVASVLAVAAVNDLLQTTFSLQTGKANQVQQPS